FFFQAEDGIRDFHVTGVQTCALPIFISAQIERITHIVRNLLDYARRREPRMESVPVSRLLDDLLEFLAAEISADGVQVQRTGRVDVAVYGDADLLHQVFINLLLNALQALRGRDSPQLRLDVSTSSTGSVVIDVEDNAGGIEEHMLEVIFDPFVTTKPAETGTGLGLAVARSIVEE